MAVYNEERKIREVSDTAAHHSRHSMRDSQTMKEQGFYQRPEWRRVRKMVLQRDHYLCQLKISEGCTKIANTVHHIKPLEDYPELALDMSNLTSCCYFCHEATKSKSRPLPSGVRIIKIGGGGDCAE